MLRKLTKVSGFNWGKSRVSRVYKELELNKKFKPSRRIYRLAPAKLKVPTRANVVWSVDFMEDKLSKRSKQLKFLSFNVIDDYNRECLRLDIAKSLPSSAVIKSLERAIEGFGKPTAIRCDNGPEFTSFEFEGWAREQGIEVLFIQLGKPQQNAYVERFNGTLRRELFQMEGFDSIDEAQLLAAQWMR